MENKKRYERWAFKELILGFDINEDKLQMVIRLEWARLRNRLFWIWK